MRSLKQQLLLLVIGPLILLAICGSLLNAFYIKDRAVLATETKAKGDLATGEAIINLMYPGPWQVREGLLYKGDTVISNNFRPVDKIADLTGDTVTIFQGDTRVSTTVRGKSGERAIGTKVSDAVADKVLKNGQGYLGQANVVGELYQTAYKPIRDGNGKIIGMFYVGISKNLSQQLIDKSLTTMLLFGVLLTLGVAMVALFFAQRTIIGPLKEITIGTREFATGHISNKVEINSSIEIADLANAFNQMVDGMQSFAMHISKVSSNIGEAQVPAGKVTPPIKNVEGMKNDYLPKAELPKGLHESTLRQIISYLISSDAARSAEEIGEGVNLTRVTARRYLEYLETIGKVEVELKYGTVGRPVKLYKSVETEQ